MPRRTSFFVRAGLLTMVTSGGTLVLNLITGILIARVLGPDGRGAVAAVIAAPAILSWIFEMGSGSAAVYYQSRHPGDAGSLIATWLVMYLPLAIAGVVTGEIVLPHLLAAQSEHTLMLARIMMLTLVLVFLADLMYGINTGDQDFAFYNLMRFAQPLAIMVACGTLWLLGLLNVTTAVVANAGALALSTVLVSTHILRRHGLARPSIAIGRSTLWYGLRAHSMYTASLVNARLDLLIIPAFVGAASVGLYSVATNVSWIVVILSGAVATVVFPTAAARGPEGCHAIVKSLYATLAIATLIAAALGTFAQFGVELIYGTEFSGSVEPLRILLVGAVMWAAAGTLCSGLYALNRPFTAAIAQLSAAAVTVTGLTLFLQHGGIRVAAIVSTVAYTLVFVIALILYRRASGLRWRDFAPTPSVMRLWVRQAARGALGRA
ncbi:MAG TPA: oligosaccharide flippase family protein [Gaiellaceae bacterium]|jgi:O-antigen/teichoic acid export membrane protein